MQNWESNKRELADRDPMQVEQGGQSPLAGRLHQAHFSNGIPKRIIIWVFCGVMTPQNTLLTLSEWGEIGMMRLPSARWELRCCTWL
jgi:hypothetical protein